MARGQGDDAAIRITTAPVNRADDIAKRQRRYLLSMSLRTICFVGAIVASLAGVHWLWPILIAGALILPYIAVVMANAAAGRTTEPGLVSPGFAHPELTGAPPPGAATGADHPRR